MQSQTLHSLFQGSYIVQRMNDCAQRCCSCSHAEPASFGEHGEGSRRTRDTTPLRRADSALVLSACRTCTSPHYSKAPLPLPPLLPLLLEEAEPAKLLASLHFQAHDGETRFSSKKEDEGATGKVDKQASQLSLPSAAYRIGNLPNIYRKQVTSTWK